MNSHSSEAALVISNIRSQLVSKLICVIAIFLLLSSCNHEKTSFGKASVVQDSAHSVSEAVLNLSYERPTRVQGIIRSICPDDGCWVVVEDDVNVLRIELGDNDIAAPNNWMGERVIVEGVIAKKVILPGSPGFDAYEKSCEQSRAQSKSLNSGTVFNAYRIERLLKQR